jgi:hypothetical protein
MLLMVTVHRQGVKKFSEHAWKVVCGHPFSGCSAYTNM